MSTIAIDNVSIKEFKEAQEAKIRKLWEDSELTSTQVVDLLKKLNRVANAELELRTQLDTFDRQLDDTLSDDEFI